MSFLNRLARERGDAVEQSVARNLTAVLNAKRGYAEAAEVFGLGGFEQHLATRPLLEALAKEMLQAILAFENRVIRAELTFLGREGSLYASFRLRADVEGRPAAFLIKMHTILRYVTVDVLPPTEREGKA